MGYLAQRGGVTIPLSVGDVVLMGCNPVLGVFQQPGKRHREAALAALEQVGLACLWGKGLFIPQRRTAAAGAVCQKPGCFARSCWCWMSRTARWIFRTVTG